MANARRDDVAGTPGTDAALLIALSFLVAHTEVAVAGVWTAVSGDFGGGAISLVNSLAHAAIRDVIVLGVAGALVYAAAGSGRQLGRDFDLGAVAYLPVAFTTIAARMLELVLGGHSWVAPLASYLGYTWSAGLVILAIAVARGGAEPRPARLRTRLAGVAILGLALASLLVSSVEIASHPERVRPVVAGDLAPSFELPTIDGAGRLSKPFNIEATRGKVVILDFWATWCGPCREAMPVLESIHREYRERGVVVLSINTEGAEVARAARAMAEELGVTSTLLSDDGRVANRFKVTTIPHMVVIDRRGVVKDVDRGFSSASRLQRRLQSVVGDLL